MLEGLLGLDLLPRRQVPSFPRATCEPGYAYDAKVRGAGLARRSEGTGTWPDRLEKEAANLERRFDRDFWVKKQAVASHHARPGRDPVDTLSSNIGHLLWSGIVDKSKAKDHRAAHLLGPRLFSGSVFARWPKARGATTRIAPRRTVSPFDDSFIAWGLRRYGFKDEAAQLAGILDSAEFFEGRLPRAFSRSARRRVPSAVPDCVQTASMVPTGSPLPAAADDARSRAAATASSSNQRCLAASAISACSTFPAAGSHRRVRTRPRGRPGGSDERALEVRR